MKKLFLGFLIGLGFIAFTALGATIFTTPQGGTGQGSFNPGDLLIGTSTDSTTGNQLYKLATGTEGQVLTITSGIPAWAASAGGGGGGAFSTTTNLIFPINTDTDYDLILGDVATSTAEFWFDESAGALTITGVVTGSNISLASSSAWDISEAIVTASSVDWTVAFNWVTASSAEWSAAIDTEADTIFVASSTDYVPWASASTSNWDIAYGWGNHASAGYLTGITGQYLSWLADVSTTTEPTEGQVVGWDSVNSLWVATTVSAGAETDPVFVASSTDYVPWSSASTSNWDIVAGNAANVTLASSSAWDIAEGIITLKVSIASTSLWDATYANTLNVTIASSSAWDIAEGWVTAFDQRWVLGGANMIYASTTYTTLGIATTSPNTAYNLAIGGTLTTDSTSTFAGLIIDNGIYNVTTTITIGSSSASCIKSYYDTLGNSACALLTNDGWTTTTCAGQCEW